MSEAERLDRREVLQWLREENEGRLAALWARADEVRRQNVGDEVHLRGLIEFSNHCVRQCAYCGLRAGNVSLPRYRMTGAEILSCARQIVACGYGTVVLQSGEDPGVTTEWVEALIRQIKAETPLAVTLSLGERSDEDLAAWREAGADRYLLRFETSNRELYERIHPSLLGRASDRPAILRTIKRLGYEAGGGVMVGLPGQTYEDLANDVELFRELDLDMIGVGPYLPHPNTPLGADPQRFAAPPGEQAPNTELMTYKMVALARLACPRANIPSTTALATLNRDRGRELGLERGANIVMPNFTPLQHRVNYEIYPAKACLEETPEQCNACLKQRVLSLGRKVGVGRGDSPNRTFTPDDAPVRLVEV
jgi:biotin synthase